jgi:hypothetical protein
MLPSGRSGQQRRRAEGRAAGAGAEEGARAGAAAGEGGGRAGGAGGAGGGVRRASKALLVSSCSSRWGRSPCGKAPCSSNAAGRSRRAETAEDRRVNGRPQSLRMAARARAACGDGLHCAGRARAVLSSRGWAERAMLRGYKLPHCRR